MIDRRSLLSAFAAAAAVPGLVRAQTGPELTVATFNIWHDRGDWALRGPMVAETLSRLDADVIGLQEVLQDAATGLVNQAESLAEALGGYQVLFSSTDAAGAPRRYGNAILSRRPILSSDQILLDPRDDFRTALRAMIDVDGRPVEVVNTHLHHTREGAAIRARQTEHLLEWLGPPAGPRLIMGDFNAELDDPGLAPLTSRFASALPRGAAATTLNPADGHESRVIDHIFVGEGFRVETAAVTGDTGFTPRLPSDHFAVVARLSLTS
ncbi:MAG TPA: endonuclease/exonuclease/phosphatase family protein [Brevundimonas sp.]|jgi:endonuclease/exonuclease/phosphatase family metal-dependent hydrolase|uniref:endonuclease/exonuclease/phosphatase family protein n=1 Tax=Brevundimonas sp. TaxID=1871086 RepID=UPI002E14331D|nr:endonuclease/exonuclease/phosphatase family protein [Brevundimonas sp.]